MERCRQNEAGGEQHRLGFLETHQLVGMRSGERTQLLRQRLHALQRALQPVGAFENADVIGEHHGLQVAQDAVGFGGGRRVERSEGFVMQQLDLPGVEPRRRQAVEVLDRAAPGDPAVADAQPDMKAGEMVGAARLREARRQQAGDVGAAVGAGADAHLGHLVERVVGRPAEHVGARLRAELAEEAVHPFDLAADEVLAHVLGNRRHVEVERIVALVLLQRHGACDARHVGLVRPFRLVVAHEGLAPGVGEAGAFLDREGDALEIELGRARPDVAELGVAQRGAGAIGEQRPGAGDVAHEAGAERDRVGAHDGRARLEHVEGAGPAVDADRAGHAAAVAAHQPGDEDPVVQRDPLGLERQPQPPAELEPAAFGIEHAREIEPARGTARVAAVLAAVKLHADRLEVPQPCVRLREAFAHQQLVGDAVVAGDDLAYDAVDVVVGQCDDHPGVGERGVAGAADHPAVDQRHPRARRSVPLGGERGEQAAGSAADHQHVGLDQGSVGHVPSPGPWPVLHRRMHVHDPLRAEDLAAEAGDAMLPEPDDGKQPGVLQPRDLGGSRDRLHVNDVGRADGVADPAARAAREVDALDHCRTIGES